MDGPPFTREFNNCHWTGKRQNVEAEEKGVVSVFTSCLRGERDVEAARVNRCGWEWWDAVLFVSCMDTNRGSGVHNVFLMTRRGPVKSRSVTKNRRPRNVTWQFNQFARNGSGPLHFIYLSSAPWKSQRALDFYVCLLAITRREGWERILRLVVIISNFKRNEKFSVINPFDIKIFIISILKVKYWNTLNNIMKESI